MAMTESESSADLHSAIFHQQSDTAGKFSESTFEVVFRNDGLSETMK